MSSGGSGTNTVVQQQQPPSQFLAGYQNALTNAQNVAARPLDQSVAPPVAGLSPDQLAGIGGIEGAQGAANPFINAGAQYIGNSQTPLQPSLQPYVDSAMAQFAAAPQYALAGQTASAGLYNTMPGAAVAGDTAASGLYRNSAAQLNPTAFSAGRVSQYESPYTQQVVNSTERQFNNQNAQQQQQVAGNAISQGAFGGDRAGVAAGITAGQQQLAEAPVIAGLENQGYAQALQEFNQQQQVGLSAQQATQQLEQGAGAGILAGTGQYLSALQGAGQGILAGSGQVAGALGQAGQGISGLGGQELGASEAQNWLASQAGFGMANLGNEALSTDLTGANALLGVGGLEQQQAQAEENVPYEQFLQQQAYPFQTSQFLTNAAEGLGSGAGGTSSTTSPGPNIGSQVLGTGLAGAGIFNLMGGSAGIGGLFGGAGAGAGAGLATTDAGVLAADDSILAGSGLAAGAGAVAAPFFHRGGHIPGRAGGGVLPFPMHRTRMSGITGSANDNRFIPHIPALRAMAGGGPTPVSIPQVGGPSLPAGHTDVAVPQVGLGPSTPPTSGGGIGAVNAYLDAAKAPPPSFHPAPAPAPPPSTGGGLGPSSSPITLAQLGVQNPNPQISSQDALMAFEQQLGNNNNGGGGGTARGGEIRPFKRDAGGGLGGDPGNDTSIVPDATQPLPAGLGPMGPPPPPPPVGQTGLAGGVMPPGGGGPGLGPLTQGASIQPQQPQQPAQSQDRSHVGEMLLATGLGILGGRSPFAGENIGRGAMQGLQFGENVRARQAQEDLRRLVAEEQGSYHQEIAAARGQMADIDRQKLAAGSAAQQQHYGLEQQRLGLDKQRLEQGHYTWQPWQQPDPNDPSKTVNGMMRVSARSDEAPQFFPTQGVPVSKTDPAAAGFNSAAAAGSGTAGDDYLKTLDPKIATQVKAIAEGRMAFPSGFALKSPYWQNMLSAVSQYDPNFDAVNYNSRSATRKDFTSGQSSKNVTSLNTVMGHLSALKDAGDALNNGSVPLFNSAVNAVKSATGNANVNNFQTAADAVADELEKSFRGTAGAVTGIRNWRERLSSNASPAQMDGAWKELSTLLDSRIEAMGDQYSRGMGRTTDGLTLLSPKAQESYARISGRQPDIKTIDQTGHPQQQTPSSVMSFPHQAVGPGGKTIFSQDGRSWFNPDGSPYEQ